jgi:hypothetical protein
MNVKTNIRASVFGFLALVLSGCASVPLDPGAQNVVFTTSKIPQTCQFLRQISSSDTNGVTTSYTSHANLQQMQINTLKNEAIHFGANVVMLTGHETTYAGQGLSKQRTSRYLQVQTHKLIGNAYSCPSEILNTLPNVGPAVISDSRQGD